MKNIEQIIKKLKKLMPILEKEYYVKNLEVFGFYTQHSQKKSSDLDLLVKFSKTIDLFKCIELENYLSEKLGVKVDLVMKDTLKPRIKDRILNDAIPV